MNRLILLAAVLLMAGVAAAQPNMRVERPDGKSAVFILGNNQCPGTTTVYLTIKETENCDISNETRRYYVTAPTARLLTLKPKDPTRGVGYSYSWRHVPGRVDPKFDSSFVYRMPCRTDRPVPVGRTTYVLDNYTKERKDRKQLGTTFLLEKGDTVYAMRRGIVTGIERPKLSAERPTKTHFSTKSVNITVEQPDGTMAWYVNFDPDHLLVEEGDRVLPGTPLGLVGSYDGEHYRISVQLLWLATDPDNDPKKSTAVRRYFPCFATTEGVVKPETKMICTAVETPEIVEREMTKKEIKKYRAGNKK